MTKVKVRTPVPSSKVTVTKPSVSTVRVKAGTVPGPKGDQGPPGEAGAASFSAVIGDGTSSTFSLTHPFDNNSSVVQVLDAATKEIVYTDVERQGTTTVVVTFASPPSANSYIVVVIG
jgi:hypothetical protein